MFEGMLKYILIPWTDKSSDTILTVLCIIMIICLTMGLYFGFKMERNGTINQNLNFYSITLIFSYLVVEVIFYWYISISLIIGITLIAKKLFRDEAKERYYAAMHGMTHKELLDIWYESEDKYVEIMETIEKMKVDEQTQRKYSFSHKGIILGFVIATAIFIFLLFFPGGYELFP